MPLCFQELGLRAMEILLHLGAHRCASTTFQSFLWNNRVQLAKQGLTCWTPKRTRDGLLRGLVRHPAMITVEDERRAIRSIGRIRVETQRLENSGQKALLISEENILGSMRNNMHDTRLYPLLQERLMRFRPAFEGHKLRIGLSIRSFEDYWTSCIVNLVARGGALPNVDLLDFLTTQPRRWRCLVRDIAAAFPTADIVIWPFERMAAKPEAQLNAIYPQDFTGLQRGHLWRNRGADVSRLNDILALRGEPLLEDGPVDVGKRWMPFDEEQRRVLRAEYSRDLSWLMAGADGLARFVDGQPEPTHDHTNGLHMLANGIGDGRITPALGPDRADKSRINAENLMLFGGRHDGIEKGQPKAGLGRSGAS